MPGHAFCDVAEVGQEAVGLGYVAQAGGVAVEVVVDDGGVGLLALGYVGEEAGAPEEVDEHGVVGVVLECLDVLAREYAFLPHERERCGKILAAGCFFSLSVLIFLFFLFVVS